MTALMDPNAATELIELAAIGARTASGQTVARDVRAFTGIGTVLLHSAAGTGTAPSLSGVTIQDSPDGSTGWAQLATEPAAAITFAPVTSTPSLLRIAFNVGACRGFVRAVWTITGTTPSFTFGVCLLVRRS